MFELQQIYMLNFTAFMPCADWIFELKRSWIGVSNKEVGECLSLCAQNYGSVVLVGGLNKFERIFLSNLFLNRLNEMQIKGYELNSAEILSKS